MPRRNKKGSKGGGARGGDSYSEDESIENISVYSNPSENEPLSVNDSEENANERYEEKFMQALENVTEKSAQTRVTALQSICEILMHRCMPDFVDDRKVTLIDCFEKSIRRGKGIEQVWAARLAPLVMLQIGGDETITKAMNQFLLTAIHDKGISFDARAKCCTALGVINFLGCNDCPEIVKLMQVFEGVFNGSYLRGDEKTPVSVSPEAATLHAEALSAWGLLLTVLPPGDFVTFMTTGQNTFPSIKKFSGLLQSSHLEVRIAAGEVIALILESGRSHDEEFLEDSLTDLIDVVKQLATDSHKYRAKRDRKAQRATFRDVLRFLEEDILPEITVRFGTENLVLDSWSTHHRYSALCSVIGGGMTLQLQENEFIRDIFELGARVNLNSMHPSIKASLKGRSKLERNYANWSAFKTRSITRGKNRDKRTAVFT